MISSKTGILIACGLLVLAAILFLAFAIGSTAIATIVPDYDNPAYIQIWQSLRGQFLNDYFTQLLGAVVGILGLVLIAGSALYGFIRQDLQISMKSNIDSMFDAFEARTVLIAFTEYSFALYLSYETTLRKILESETPTSDEERKEALAKIKLARSTVENGLNKFDRMPKNVREIGLQQSSTISAYVQAYNSFYYSLAAEMVISEKLPAELLQIDFEETLQFILEKSLSKELASENFPWWEPYETIAFFKLQAAILKDDAALRTEANEMINVLVSRASPKRLLGKPPEQISEVARKEYSISRYSGLIELPN
ncbi:hypothetical protein [Donghicola mangrovi]|uniref:Uncharacterized protein n=1 Tax=Donghicola mangrovi TaxID=2729614 RepID=A0A850Q639_9RHOB|nr:hypothetical protein [Donghicola mangrovi]NVO22518.1 hypothetical protein [Donghicola mangrovi]